ncbi:MAG TPA: hypothetical protein PLP50_00255 [Thermoanaerobaculia bacterium]|jgi:hypothetical protein|nr:hypothetical protein [Thermoanaerobaculia bacterium]HPA50002.1 hypothetical protein [Thermoanaerobaculia bacterium]HQN06126.1 hypothetical protein [Thermoanaerobaculia bacterium]HQP87696.1 hypothetical protein [Thermoanaerobaculia bacterium]
MRRVSLSARCLVPIALFAFVTIAAAGVPPNDTVTVRRSSIRLVAPATVVPYRGGSRCSYLFGPSLQAGPYTFQQQGSGLHLRDERTGEERWIAISELAESAGWPLDPGSHRMLDDTSGMAVGNEELWVGTKGAGILAYSPHAGTWRRYDCKEAMLPGHHMIVSYADDSFVFATNLYHRDLPTTIAEPSLHVYSYAEEAWFEVLTVPSAGGTFTKCPPEMRAILQRAWDHTALANEPAVALKAAGLVHPRVVWVPEEGTYILEFPHRVKELELVTRLRLARADLDGALLRCRE